MTTLPAHLLHCRARGLSIASIAALCLLAGCTGRPTGKVPSTDDTLPARSTTPAARCTVPLSEHPPVTPQRAADCPTDPVFGGHTFAHGPVQFLDAPDQPIVDAELAIHQHERGRGLMFRTHLPETSGMLFFPQGPPRIQSFWMRNTCIPLDMIFIEDDGYIAGIAENVPTLNDESRSVPCPTSYVLEVNAGWCRRHGVQPGGRVKLPAKP